MIRFHPVLKAVFITLKVLIRTFYFALTAIAVFALAYFFAFPILFSPLSGNDSGNHLSFIFWINKYWPHVPVWWPLQGGGVSFIQGYPTLYHFSVVLMHQLSGISLTAAMGLINFLSIPATAIGVYLFVWWRFKNQTAAAIASIFYLLSPMVYAWNSGIGGVGFLATTFSYFLVPISFAFFDAYHTTLIEENGKKRAVTYLLLGALTTAVSFVAHPSTGMGLVLFVGLYGIIWPLIILKKGQLLSVLKRSIFGAFSFISCTMALAAFWFYPFYRYQNFSTLSTIATPQADLSVQPKINFLGNLQLWKAYDFPNFSVPPAIWILAIVGIILAFLYNKRVFVWGLLGFFALYMTGSYLPWLIVYKISPFLAVFFSLRPSAPVALTLVPVSAAFGAVFIAKSLLLPILLFIKKTPGWIHNNFEVITTAFLSLVVAGATLYFANGIGAFHKYPKDTVYYGPYTEGINIGNPWIRPWEGSRCEAGSKKYFPDLCGNPAVSSNLNVDTLIGKCDEAHFKKAPSICTGQKQIYVVKEVKIGDMWTKKGEWQTAKIDESDVQAFLNKCEKDNGEDKSFSSLCVARYKSTQTQLALKNWPIYNSNEIKNDFPNYKKDIEDKIGNLIRVDISPKLGSTVRDFGINNDISIINAYTGQLVTQKPFFGIFQTALYTKENPLPNPTVLNQISSWFGLEAVFLSGDEPFEKYEQSGWVMGPQVLGGLTYSPKNKTSVATLENKPMALVIGDSSKNAYEMVFRLAINGVLPYERLLTVEGTKNIDDYSLEELGKFKLIILNGYSYKNKNKAWDELKKYVEDGGSLFVDTGWQYVAKDWGKMSGNKSEQINLPEPLPVSKSEWGDVGTDWSGSELKEFSGEVKTDSFSPLTYLGSVWRESLASETDLRSGSNPILIKDGKVLIASREFGKGRVVWSGMNLPAHSVNNKNQEEMKLFGDIVNYLVGEEKGSQTIIDFQRNNPDRVIFNLDGSKEGEQILWREFNYPGWKAYSLVEGKKTPLKIRLAGPRMSLIDLPSDSTKVILEYQTPLSYKIALMLSLFTLLLLLSLIVDLTLFKGKVSSLVSQPVKSLVNKQYINTIRGLKEQIADENE